MNNDKFISLSAPNLKGNELKYITHAVESEWVSTAGVFVTDFENKVSEYVGTPGAISCQNGTAGLHISLVLCGVTCEDMVIVPSVTFIAAVNPTKYIGAEPIFMDCDDSICLDPIKLEMFCREDCEMRNGSLYHKESGKRIPAMVIVHVFGNMADMENLLNIAETYNIKVVEDATEALGTRYVKGKYSGKFAGTMGTLGVFSFNGNKIITTGGGGMIVSHNEEILRHAKHLTTQAKTDEVYFTHDEIGYNYRLTNLQAALGLAQMEQLEQFIETKRENYEYFKRELNKQQGLTMLDFREGTRANCWFYSLYVDKLYSKTPGELIKHLKEHNIQIRPIWGLIHKQIPYKNCYTYKIEKAIDYSEHIVNLPCSTNLTKEDVDRVIETIKN